MVASLAAIAAIVGGSASSLPAGATGPKAGEPTLLGNYLAGRHARSLNDTAAAAGFYRNAMQLDPPTTC